MPCFNAMNGVTSEEILKITNETLRDEVNLVTRILCDVLTQYEAKNDIVLNPESRLWWAAHKNFDEKRKTSLL